MVSPCHKKIANNFRISNQKHKDVRFPKVTNVFDGVVENSLGNQLRIFFNFAIDVSHNRLIIYFFI